MDPRDFEKAIIRKEEQSMTELEKLDAGLPYHFLDADIAARKKAAVINCRKFNDADPLDYLVSIYRFIL